MNSGEPGRVIASAFALAGFAVAMIAGLAAGNPAGAVIKTGLVAMIVCYAAGVAIGSVAQSVVAQHLSGLRTKAESGATAAAPAHGEIGRSAEAAS